MPYKSSYIIFILLYFSAHIQLNAQKNSYSALPTTDFIYSPDLLTYISPSAQVLSNQYMVNIKYASYIGLRKVMNETYFDAWYRLKEKKGLSFGLQLYNNNQGPFIHLNNIKLLSRYLLNLNYKYNLCLGMGLGAISYNFDSNDKNAGGADAAPDADVGLSIQSKKVNAGISLKSLIDRTVNPIEVNYRKNFLSNIYFSKEWQNNPDYKLRTSLVGTYFIYSKSVTNDYFVEAFYKKNLKLIALLYHYQTFGYGFGLENIETPIGNLGFNLLYSNGLGNSVVISSERYEIGIKYFFK